jgi:hypothetical protein
MAEDDAEAWRLADRALELIKNRRARYYIGEVSYLAQIEDIFLTLEGSGQWAGYQWLTSPKGGAVTPAEAIPAFARRGGWWSQTEGLALILAIDRLDDRSWKAAAFGDGSMAGIALLEQALNAGSPRRRP